MSKDEGVSLCAGEKCTFNKKLFKELISAKTSFNSRYGGVVATSYAFKYIFIDISFMQGNLERSNNCFT